MKRDSSTTRSERLQAVADWQSCALCSQWRVAFGPSQLALAHRHRV